MSAAIIFLLAQMVTSVTSAQDMIWEPTAVDTSIHVRTFFEAGSGAVFAASDRKLLRSGDLGDTWTALDLPEVNDMTEDQDGNLLAAGARGVHRSTDGGTTWEELLPPPWRDVCGPDLMQFFFVVVSPDGTILTESPIEWMPRCKWDTAIYLSYDSGATWWEKAGSGARSGVISADGVLFTTGLSGHVYRLKAWSERWQRLPWERVLEQNNLLPALAMNGEGHLFVGADISRACCVEAAGREMGKGVYRSTDEGDSWTKINSGLTDTTITSLTTYPGGHVFVGTWSDGVFHSVDNGDSWTAVNDGLPGGRITALGSTAEGVVFVGTESGIFRGTVPLATSTEFAPELPERVVLHQNYPNPFNPTTTIPFSLDEPRHVTLTVFDMLGREVVRLADEYRAAGDHSVVFSASGLSSGVYVYALVTGNARLSRRMVVLE